MDCHNTLMPAMNETEFHETEFHITVEKLQQKFGK